jgi:hypothetical protein
MASSFHSSKLLGIGIALRWEEQANKVMVGEVWQGSPAAHSGLLAVGDYIIRGILYDITKPPSFAGFDHHFDF